jgi:hypothetical protein
MKICPRKGIVLLVAVSLITACTTQRVLVEADLKTERMLSKINRVTDPRYVYEYQQTRFVPPPGKTLLIMGQTVEAIAEYLDSFPDQPVPGGWSAYWAVTEFKGITEAYRNVTGSTQDHQLLVDRFPNTVLHSAMWMVGSWDVAQRAADGEFDNVIRQYADWVKKINQPVLLRIGYEFDGIHNALEPAQYVRAYRRIVDLLRDNGASNVAFVWHSYAAPRFNNYPLAAWYPGDDYVDWMALSIFGQAYENPDMGPEADEMLEFARQHNKPLMLAETNPVQGIEKGDDAVWDDWFVNLFSFVHDKNIKAISFINEDWNRLAIEGIEEWGDARLYNNPRIADLWFKETGNSRYLKQSPGLFRQLGYAP